MNQTFAQKLEVTKSIFEYNHIHLVGIKGVAMTSLALCLQDAGKNVTGSDVVQDFVTEKILKERRFHIFHGFSPDHVTKDIDLVVYTGAHNGSYNLEVEAAHALGIPTMSHAEALGNLIANKKVISVCGTGGKSTTSAMIAWILEKAGMKPSFAIGVGNIPNFGVSGRFVKDSEWFVAEADEYAVDPTGDLRPRFIYQHPEIIVCTNLNYDHPDIYKDFESMKQVFLNFFNSLPDDGTLVANINVPFPKTKAHMIQVHHLDEMIHLRIPGDFNKMNATMASEVTKKIGIDTTIALDALSEFKGTMRRFEYKGKVNRADWYDDYAHTPDEIQPTLKALKEWCPGKKIIALFQPHTFSRTRALFDGFSQCFTDADEIILLDIFPSAREQSDPTVSSDLLVEAIAAQNEKKIVKNMKTIEHAAVYMSSNASKDNVVITLGAGDVYKIYDHIRHS